MSKINAAATGSRSRARPRLPRLAVAAIAAALVVALGTTALAASGALSDIFAAFYGPLGNGSRRAIVDEGFISEVSSAVPSPTTGAPALELCAYYIGGNELGLDFTLTGVDIPDKFFNYQYIGDFSLELTDKTGAVIIPECLVNARAVKINGDTCDLSVIAEFRDPDIPVGGTARLTLGDINFMYLGDISDDDAVDEYFVIDGSWSFDFHIDDKFAEATELRYVPAEPGENQGVTVTSVTVLPTSCRIEAAIDFSKNTLGLLDSAAMSQESGYPQAKYDLLGTGFRAEADGRTYRGISSEFTDVTDGVVQCVFIIDSMYFDKPETLTLKFWGDAGYENDIEIPLVLET
jgi:hypothetical protein